MSTGTPSGASAAASGPSAASPRSLPPDSIRWRS